MIMCSHILAGYMNPNYVITGKKKKTECMIEERDSAKKECKEKNAYNRY